MIALERLLGEYTFTQGLSSRHIKILVGCARYCQLSAGEYLWKQGQPADGFYLVQSGEVALGISVPHGGQLQIDSIGADEVVGWSWFMPPYLSHFDVWVTKPVVGVALDTRCLRQLYERDRELRCELLSRIAPIVIRRLETTQSRLVELYRV